jgi:hypothetical protein
MKEGRGIFGQGAAGTGCVDNSSEVTRVGPSRGEGYLALAFEVSSFEEFLMIVFFDFGEEVSHL